MTDNADKSKRKPNFGPGSNFKGRKGRSGAKAGNKNALKNGSRVDVKRLTVGELPSQMIAIKREGRKYRRDLEAEVMAVHNRINTTQSHLIDTATAATIQAGICRWLLRHKLEDMSTSDIRGCSADIVKAKASRDAAVKALGLDAPPKSPWEIIDATPSNGNDDDEQAE